MERDSLVEPVDVGAFVFVTKSVAGSPETPFETWGILISTSRMIRILFRIAGVLLVDLRPPFTSTVASDLRRARITNSQCTWDPFPALFMIRFSLNTSKSKCSGHRWVLRCPRTNSSGRPEDRSLPPPLKGRRRTHVTMDSNHDNIGFCLLRSILSCDRNLKGSRR